MAADKSKEKISCQTCKFNDQGKCHLNPPTFFRVNETVYPQVTEADWCSKHKPAAKIQDEKAE